MKLLAIDTATEACSAALMIDGDIVSEYQLAPRQHSHLILNMVEHLLQRADCSLSTLDALAYGRGPGSFMGVRIAAGVVQGIAYAHSLPVVPVSTLAAIASSAMDRSGSHRVLAAIDARMAEVYWGAYSRDAAGGLRLQGEECVCAPAQVPLPAEHDWTGAGSGWASYADELSQRLHGRLAHIVADCYPSAHDIVQLAAIMYQQGKVVTAAEAVPVYLRDNVAKKPASMKPQA